MAVSRQRLRRQLIEHDEQDIRALAARRGHGRFLRKIHHRGHRGHREEGGTQMNADENR
jgi:hypothetical protein